MKKVLFIFAVVLAFWLYAGIGNAQQHGSKGTIVKPGATYNSEIVYAGRYRTNILFFKGSGSEFWKSLPRFDRLQYVTCSEALQHLKQAGIWKGSLLLKNGSCVAGGQSGDGGVEQPAEWALGNWLNFTDQVIQQ